MRYSIISAVPVKLMQVVSVLALISLGQCVDAQQEGNLIRVKDDKGRESSLLEKVVVVDNQASISKSPTTAGEYIGPWSIFFRIKNEDGSTKSMNGRLRVGDATGNPVGWIDEKYLKQWNTRFILDPIDPQPERKFVVQLGAGDRAVQNATPEGKKRYALITENPMSQKGDDTEYPVVVYAGNVESVSNAGTLARESKELSNVKLEIVFVIESSDFMFRKFNKSEDKSCLDFLKDSIRRMITDLRSDEKIRKAVRLGFAEYKDNVPGASFGNRLTCDLTEDFDKFSNALELLKPEELRDDNPDDVIGGLNQAISNATWTENSVKHVILLGMMDCQLAERGKIVPLTSPLSPIEPILKIKRGYNATGLSINQLISKARPQGGSDSRARTTKMLHAFHFSREAFADVPPDERKDVENAIEKINDVVRDASRDELIEAASNEDVYPILQLIYGFDAYNTTLSRAKAQYNEISKNNGETDGIFRSVGYSSDEVSKAASILATKIKDTFTILEKVRDGKGLQPNSGNEIAQPLFTLIGANAEKLKKQEVFVGTAATRDERGREVAFKKVMVSEKELTRLRSTLDAMYTTFKSKSSKSDRQDVGQILENLKAIVAATSAGQNVTADAKLKDLISDLPLRSAALDTSAADLALMTTEAFTEWLERIESAVFRIDDLLKSRQDWLVLSERAVNDKFTFLKLSELP